ncbi:hypothetical protein D3C80_2059140 [compost metagenome]
MQFRLCADGIGIKQKNTGIEVARYIALLHQSLQLTDTGHTFFAHIEIAGRPFRHNAIAHRANRTSIEIKREKWGDVAHYLRIAINIENTT